MDLLCIHQVRSVKSFLQKYVQIETPPTKMAGGCRQFSEQPRLTFEPAHHPGSHR